MLIFIDAVPFASCKSIKMYLEIKIIGNNLRTYQGQ